MDYFNKFQSFVTQKVSSIKNQIEGKPKQNDYVLRGMNIMEDINSQPFYSQSPQNSQSNSSSSLSAFLRNESNEKQNAPPTQNINQVFAINPFIEQKKKETSPDSEFIQDFELMRGESTIEWERCEIKIEENTFPCKALITPFRLYCIPNFTSNIHLNSTDLKVLGLLYQKDYFSIPHHQISQCEKKEDQIDIWRYKLYIKALDGREFYLLFHIGQNDSFFFCLSNLVHMKETPNYSSFAIKYNYQIIPKEDGWNIYSPEREFSRQGLSNLDTSVSDQRPFRRTTLNENYSLCETYPKFLITVAKVSDEELKQVSLFRTKNRIPALSYFYYKNKGTIWRSSQAKAGITGNRNQYDERYLSLIANVSTQNKLYIYDARPYMSAMANKLKGAGFEIVENYINCEIYFCQIDNIHAGRNALNKVINMLSSTDFCDNKNYYSKFDSTKWPEFIFLIIKSSMNIARSIKDGNSVLIHCSDGWDRASQLTAFSQMLIDPYYRTIRGYITLIEKDFCSFGHQFKYRNGYFSEIEVKENQFSPIFLQYLDATHQLLVQYPMYFEFNMEFLVFIANNITSGKYGTFLYNHDRDRDLCQAKNKTMSIWTEMIENISKYTNPFYEKRTSDEYFLLPVFTPNKIRLWEEYFMQYLQLSAGVSYDIYIAKWYNIEKREKENEKKDKFDNRIISNVQFANKLKIDQKEDEKEKDDEIKKLRKCIEEILSSNTIKDDEISDESKKILASFIKDDKKQIYNVNVEEKEFKLD